MDSYQTMIILDMLRYKKNHVLKDEDAIQNGNFLMRRGVRLTKNYIIFVFKFINIILKKIKH